MSSQVLRWVVNVSTYRLYFSSICATQRSEYLASLHCHLDRVSGHGTPVLQAAVTPPRGEGKSGAARIFAGSDRGTVVARCKVLPAGWGAYLKVHG
jgi:hypothetical protein